MGLFRNKVLFRAERELPDPEELTLRFRRRVVVLTSIGALCLLSIPVLRDQIPALDAHRSARKLAEILLDSRVLASQTRSPVLLTVTSSPTRAWIRSVRGATKDCTQEAPGPKEQFPSDPVEWRLSYLAENAVPGSAEKEVHEICFHPYEGLYVNHELLKEGQLQVLVRPEEDISANRIDRVQRITIQNHGSEISLEPSGS